MSDLTVSPGETLVRDVTVYSDATHATPLDLDGATVVLAVYDAPQGTEIEDLTTNAAVVDETDGTVTFTLDVEADSDFHVYWYELMLTESDTTATIIDSGKLTIGTL